MKYCGLYLYILQLYIRYLQPRSFTLSLIVCSDRCILGNLGISLKLLWMRNYSIFVALHFLLHSINRALRIGQRDVHWMGENVFRLRVSSKHIFIIYSYRQWRGHISYETLLSEFQKEMSIKTHGYVLLLDSFYWAPTSPTLNINIKDESPRTCFTERCLNQVYVRKVQASRRK